MQPTHASFFSGVGGLDLGLERAGWRTVSFSVTPTPRQIEVLEAIVITGGTVAAAQRLRLSYYTVKAHVTNMQDRTGHRIEQLAYIGLRDGWLTVRAPIKRALFSR